MARKTLREVLGEIRKILASRIDPFDPGETRELARLILGKADALLAEGFLFHKAAAYFFRGDLEGEFITCEHIKNPANEIRNRFPIQQFRAIIGNPKSLIKALQDRSRDDADPKSWKAILVTDIPATIPPGRNGLWPPMSIRELMIFARRARLRAPTFSVLLGNTKLSLRPCSEVNLEGNWQDYLFYPDPMLYFGGRHALIMPMYSFSVASDLLDPLPGVCARRPIGVFFTCSDHEQLSDRLKVERYCKAFESAVANYEAAVMMVPFLLEMALTVAGRIFRKVDHGLLRPAMHAFSAAQAVRSEVGTLPLDPHLRETLDTLLTNVSCIARHCKHVEAYFRGHRGLRPRQPGDTPRAVAAKDLIDEVVREMQCCFGRCPHIDVDAGKDAVLQLETREEEGLLMVLYNLLCNALDEVGQLTGPPPVTVRASTTKLRDRDGQEAVAFSISNPMRENPPPHLIDMLKMTIQNRERYPTTKDAGFGIGLLSCARILENLEAEFEIRGDGVFTFEFRMPKGPRDNGDTHS